MNYKELKERYYELEKRNHVTSINHENVDRVLKDLVSLRDAFMSNYFDLKTVDDFLDLENLKIKITENILLCKMSRNAFMGVQNRELEIELDAFYSSNGRIY